MCLKILPTQVREHCINATGMTVIVTNKAGCPVPGFFLFFDLIPIFSYFKTKTSYFSYCLDDEATICNKIENGI